MNRYKPCTQPGCPVLVPAGQGRCEGCEKAAEARRGSSWQRGYDRRHQAWRRAVLARDRWCVVCGDTATEADHWPRSRRELVAAGLSPVDPSCGRGLCKRCHSRATAMFSPGGWAERQR